MPNYIYLQNTSEAFLAVFNGDILNDVFECINNFIDSIKTKFIREMKALPTKKKK